MKSEHCYVLGHRSDNGRFSSSHVFEGTSPWVRGAPFLKEATKAYNSRTKLVSIEALQGASLIGFAAAVEGDRDQDALLSCQAIRMVQLLGLPLKLSADSLRRQLEIRRKHQRLQLAFQVYRSQSANGHVA